MKDIGSRDCIKAKDDLRVSKERSMWVLGTKGMYASSSTVSFFVWSAMSDMLLERRVRSLGNSEI